MLNRRQNVSVQLNRWSTNNVALYLQYRCETQRSFSSGRPVQFAARRGLLPPRIPLKHTIAEKTTSEELLRRLEEDNRLKGKRLREESTESKKRQELRDRMEIGLNELRKATIILDREIPLQIKEARWLGRSDYQLIPVREIEEQSSTIKRAFIKVTAQLKRIVYFLELNAKEELEKNRQHEFDARAFYIDDKIEKLEDEVTAMFAGYYSIKNLVHEYMQRFFEEKIAESAAIAEKTLNIVIARTRMKDEDSQSGRLTRKLNEFRSTLIELDQILQSLVQIKEGRVMQELKKAREVLRNMAIPVVPSRPTGDWSSVVGQLAHNAREIELNMLTAQSLPELTFALRWSSSIKARYTWPLRDGRWDLMSQLRDLTLALPGGRMLKYTTPRRQAWIKKATAITRELRIWSKKTDRICDLFDGLIGNGYNALCPHPDPYLYHIQAKTVRFFEHFDRGWDMMVEEAKELDSLLIIEREDLETQSSLRDIELRRLISKRLNGLIHPLQNRSNPISRRGILSDRNDLLIWRGSRVLAESEESSVIPSATIAASVEARPLHNAANVRSPLARSDLDSRQALQRAWLDNRSLYPDGARIPVDFVLSPKTFYHMVDEILKQRVVGIDIHTSPCDYISASKVRYVVMASTYNIYILDWWQVSAELGSQGLFFLDKILSDPSVLKVGMDVKWFEQIIWDEFHSDMKGFHDLARYRLPGEPDNRTGTAVMLQRLFGNHDFAFKSLPARFVLTKRRFDADVIYDVAMRAYVPLQLFHHLNSFNHVETNDVNVLFDVRKYYEKLKTPLFRHAEIGPVIIDRCGRELVPKLDQRTAKGPSTVLPLWQDWLLSSSYSAASSLLKLSSDSDNKLPAKENKVLNAVTAYYMATKFGESLHVIEQVLGLRDPACWVLWAANEYGLHLSTNDRQRYSEVVGSRDIALQDLRNFDERDEPTKRKAISRPRRVERRLARTNDSPKRAAIEKLVTQRSTRVIDQPTLSDSQNIERYSEEKLEIRKPKSKLKIRKLAQQPANLASSSTKAEQTPSRMTDLTIRRLPSKLSSVMQTALNAAFSKPSVNEGHTSPSTPIVGLSISGPNEPKESKETKTAEVKQPKETKPPIASTATSVKPKPLRRRRPRTVLVSIGKVQDP